MRLAGLDAIARAGADKLDFASLDNIDPQDIEDLRALYNLAEKADFSGRSVLLNPIFGAASFMVGGADADLMIDGTVVGVKTTKKTAYRQARHLSDSRIQHSCPTLPAM
jgi:demethoxyubiquinone hydroxylase (CLK1/Coq7/Cat5 family)